MGGLRGGGCRGDSGRHHQVGRGRRRRGGPRARPIRTLSGERRRRRGGRGYRTGMESFITAYNFLGHSNIFYVYRATLVVVDLGWVDFDSDVPSSCPAAQPVLPNPHWPQQNREDIGTSKYKSTQPRSATTSVTL